MQCQGCIGRVSIGMVFAFGLCFVGSPSFAWVLSISAAPRKVFLQVGNGAANVNNTTVNVVSLVLPTSQIGTGASQLFTSDSSQSLSPYDGRAVCVPPKQVYVGAAYQSNTASDPGSAQLQVSSPASLISSSGETIPFSQINWSSTASGMSAGDIASGTFNGGTLWLSTISKNTWVENCLTFSYANSSLVSAGTYTGRVTYTMSAP